MAATKKNTSNKTVKGREPAASENVVVIDGSVRAEPTVRALQDDNVLLTFDLISGIEDDRRTVPVSWQGPARSMPKVAPDDRLMILGTAQRRFFRVGGVTAHTVDVRADSIARTPAAKRKLRARAVGRLMTAD